MESKILIDPQIHDGKPVLGGAHAPVELVLAELRNGSLKEAIALSTEFRPQYQCGAGIYCDVQRCVMMLAGPRVI